MIGPLLSAAQLRLEDSARRGLLALGALILLLVGIGFLTAAAWLLIADWQGAIVACAVIGFALIIAALIFALVARRRRVAVVSSRAKVAAVDAQTPTTVSMGPALAQAFMTGLNVGLSGKRKN